MSEIQNDIVEYISTAQPELEKLAQERSSMLNRLNSKLTAMMKAGSLTKDEATSIMKSAQYNITNVLDFLDVPTYHHRIGHVSKEATINRRDPLEEFAFS